MESETVKQTAVTQTPAGNVQTEKVTVNEVSLKEFILSKTSQIIFTFVGIIGLLLLLRIILLLLGANRVGIVNFIMDITQIFVTPFTGIFPSPSSGDSYLDVASIVAIIMTIVFGFILTNVVKLLSKETE